MKVVKDVKRVKKSSTVFKDLETRVFYTASTSFTRFMSKSEKRPS